ncbi:hypothetical protein [Atlanticothrix silvestris]|nr:hypothetical protein [Atlanticothrix silvestris]
MNRKKPKGAEINFKQKALPASDRDLVILAEKLTEFEVPLNVLLQAMSIAAYDGTAAFRYADHYLNHLNNKNELESLFLLQSNTDLENSLSLTKKISNLVPEIFSEQI